MPRPSFATTCSSHYQPIFGRFFEAFARALPQLPRSELGLRLHFALKALSGVLAADDMNELVAELSMGQTISDAELLARLVALVSPALTAPLGTPQQIAVIDGLLRLSGKTCDTPPVAGKPPCPVDVRTSPA